LGAVILFEVSEMNFSFRFNFKYLAFSFEIEDSKYYFIAFRIIDFTLLCDNYGLHSGIAVSIKPFFQEHKTPWDQPVEEPDNEVYDEIPF
jgi:hypothetical protein